MFGINWGTSRADFGVAVEKGIKIPTSSGITLDADLFRPDAAGKYPILLSVHAYSKDDQSAELTPIGMNHGTAHIEAGNSRFFARRGYIHVIANIRGTGDSEGSFGNLDSQSIQDLYDAIEWLAVQPWSTGRVGMFGVSYFSLVQQRTAAIHPPSLACIFAPYGWNDAYRDRYYHGGILSWKFMQGWVKTLSRPRIRQNHLEKVGQEQFDKDLDAALSDPEIAGNPFLRQGLLNPNDGQWRHVSDILLNPLDGDYFRERSVDLEQTHEIPAYFGGCWGVYGLHLPGAFRAFGSWKGAKRLTIGPAVYLDRPVYQYHEEALRWFDHWLKDNDTGLMDEKPVQVFIENTGEWKSAESWPLPETKWMAFNLHSGGILSEHEYWSSEPATKFVDSPHERGTATFTTPKFVESTEVCGPIVLNLYASTTATEVLWFVSLLEVDGDGNERILTRGWLRGSQRRLVPEKSKPWQPYHAHTAREALVPGEVSEFNIEVRPIGVLLKPGSMLRLRVRTVDDEKPKSDLESVNMGHLAGATSGIVTIHHEDKHPSHLLLPITRGNRIGTFMSGGSLPLTI